jgi:hypothetical protein
VYLEGKITARTAAAGQKAADLSALIGHKHLQDDVERYSYLSFRATRLCYASIT